MQVGDAPRGWFKWQGAEARILLIISVSCNFWDQTGLTISGLDAMLMQTAIVNDSDVQKFLRLKVTLD
jgi:hypothetical protein